MRGGHHAWTPDDDAAVDPRPWRPPAPGYGVRGAYDDPAAGDFGGPEYLRAREYPNAPEYPDAAEYLSAPGYLGAPEYLSAPEYPGSDGYRTPEDHLAPQDYLSPERYSAPPGYPAVEDHPSLAGYRAPMEYPAAAQYQPSPGYDDGHPGAGHPVHDDSDGGPVAAAAPARGRPRRPGTIGLATLVAALLAAFGAGAALLSPSFASGRAGAPNSAPANGPLAAAAPSAEPLAGAVPTPTPTPTPARSRTRTAAPPKVERATAKPKPRKTTPRASSRTTTLEDEVTALVNQERTSAGCGRVRTDERLRKAARAHSQDMADRNYFSHTSLDGRSPWDRAKAAGYAEPIGENIAKGQPTPEAVMRAWMDSEGHRDNILNCDAKAIGVGLAYDGGAPVWTQLFGAA